MKDFDQLWRENLKSVRRLARLLAHNSEDAEDLVGDTALLALGTFHLFKPESSFLNWVCCVMARAHIRVLRKQARSPKCFALELLRTERFPYATYQSEGRFNASALWDELVSELCPGDVRVLKMLAEGFGTAEIGDRFGVSPAVARCRVNRLRQRLQR